MSFIDRLGIPFWVLVIFVSGNNAGTVAASEPYSSLVRDWTNVYQTATKGHLPWASVNQNVGLFDLEIGERGQYEARLISPEVPSLQGGGCLTFSEIVTMGAMVEVLVGSKLVWARIDHNANWRMTRVTLGKELTQSPFKITIRGALNNGRKQRISIKEGVFNEGECEKENDTFSGIHKCHFGEEGLCNWEKSSGKAIWDIEEGFQHYEFFGFRNFSRTRGSYASVKMPSDGSVEQSSVEMTSPVLNGHPSCVRFFYLLDGYGTKNPGDFTITVKKEGFDTQYEVLKISGTQGVRWREALVTLHFSTKYRIVVGFTPAVNKVSMAIDDIRITKGKCPALDLHKNKNTVSCDFDPNEKGCKFTTAPYYGQKYEIVEGSDIAQDSELIALHKVSEPRAQGPAVASVLSQIYSTNEPRICLTFDYNINSTNETRLFFSTSADHFSGPRWYRAMSTSDGWRTSMFEVDVTNNFQFDFHSSIKPNATGYVAIGRYSINNSPCPTKDNYMCTFEVDSCGWYSKKDIDTQSVWTRNSGLYSPKTGPGGDQSYYAGTGYYMVFKTEGLNRNDIARLTHDFPPKTSPHCLSFWWNMRGKKNGMGKLEVRVRPTGESTTSTDESVTLWTRLYPLGWPFVYGQVEVPVKYMEKPFQVSFLAVAGDPFSDIAVDEVNFEDVPCASVGGNL